MGMSTRVVGVRVPDDQYYKMLKVYESCTAAGIGVPDDVKEYFDWTDPSPNGSTIELPSQSYLEVSADMRKGIQVELSKLPKHITHVIFWNSW